MNIKLNIIEEEEEEEKEDEDENNESASKIPTKEEAYHQLESVVKCIEISSCFSEKDMKLIKEIRERLVDINFANLYQSDIRNYFEKL